MDVVFLPMNLPYTMTPDQVASALAAMAPKIAYIFHYLDTNPRDLDRPHAARQPDRNPLSRVVRRYLICVCARLTLASDF